MLHRRRVWSEVQRQWMGWERKRGKLHELNRLLRGATDTTFQEVGGRPPQFPQTFATLSRSTLIPSCRGRLRGVSSAKWPTP